MNLTEFHVGFKHFQEINWFKDFGLRDSAKEESSKKGDTKQKADQKIPEIPTNIQQEDEIKVNVLGGGE